MRGKLSDNDLTNYALNDGLDSRERLYVESMLAVSESCREDVYKLIDLGQLLEEGFDREHQHLAADVGLTQEQRAALLAPRRQPQILQFVYRTAGTLAAAACVAFVFAHAESFQQTGPGRKVAKVTEPMWQMVSGAVAQDQTPAIAEFVDLRAEDFDAAWIQTVSDGMPTQAESICTPPTPQPSTEYTDERAYFEYSDVH